MHKLDTNYGMSPLRHYLNNPKQLPHCKLSYDYIRKEGYRKVERYKNALKFNVKGDSYYD